jgi:hypothetical protein
MIFGEASRIDPEVVMTEDDLYDFIDKHPEICPCGVECQDCRATAELQLNSFQG